MRDGYSRIRPHTIIALVEDRPGVLNRIASKVRQRSFNIEATGEEHKIDNLVELLQDYEIIELVRTGRVAMLRGSEESHPQDEEEEEHFDRAPGVHTW